MSAEILFNNIQNSGIGLYLGKQDHLLGAFAELFHIAGLILVLAPILLINLRLLGVGLNRQPLPQLTRATTRFIWIGLAFLVLSGLVLFVPAANIYYPNSIFWFKFKVLLGALVVHLTLFRKVSNTERPGKALAATTAILSLTLWFSVAFAGRFIGFF